MHLPFVHRLDSSEWPILLLSLLLIYFETLISFITELLPGPIIRIFDDFVKLLYSNIPSNKPPSRLKQCRDFEELCQYFDYQFQNHVVRTQDDYILNIHRILPKKPNGKVVYFHHGLLMNSEVWLTMIHKNQNIPLVLSDLGYDVWLGNNRGNKYSKKHLSYKLSSFEFWDFSMDEFALYDIPNTIEYILAFVNKPKLTYIGFSQGTAQGFAALSINRQLNRLIDGFIALSPAMTPKGLHHPVVDTLMKTSPILMYLFFGRRALLNSTPFWQSIIYPPLFIKVIDYCNILLFNWYGHNILTEQKLLSYQHLYSATSVKTVVHWFQIIRNKCFQMFDDSYTKNSESSDFHATSYPTRNISTPILLIYGKSDSLVDLKDMVNQLNPSLVQSVGIDHYEHLEVLWGKAVESKVITEIIRFMGFLENNSKPEEVIQEKLKQGSDTE